MSDTPPTMANDPLLAAVRLGLLPSDNYDDAWDALEERSPGRYLPDDATAEWLRSPENWTAAVAGEVSSTAPTTPNLETLGLARIWVHAWMAPFLACIQQGGSVSSAARAAGVHRDTAYKHRQEDADFAAAWKAVAR